MSRGARVRATKSPERRAARAGWHSFGEYALLEDSRYASQRQNVRRNRGFGDAGWQCFWRATIANIFRARRLLPSLAALAHTALRIVGMRRRRLTERPPRARLGAKWGRRDRVCGTAFGRAAWQAGPLRRRLRSLRRSRRRTKSAAAASQPGFSLASTYYHTSTSAGSEVARARLIRIGRAAVEENVSAISISPEDLATVTPSYAFATPVLGGQAGIALTATYGRKRTTSDAVITTAPRDTPFATTRFDTISDVVTGFGDLSPQVSLRWNAGVHNVMTYLTGNIPVGAYSPVRLSNIGIGHSALDGGAGYTYFNEQTGYEFSAVAGLTYNFINPYTQYQSGVDEHLDWGASRFLTKQLQIGLAGYLYNQASCDGGSGDRVGCFQSRVASVGGQLGYTIPMGELEGNVNVRAYKEFAAANRPEGWNLWLTYTLSPAEAAPARSPTAAVPAK